MASIEKRSENTFRITVCIGYDTKGEKIRKRQTVTIDPKLTSRQKEKELNRLAAQFESEVTSGTYTDGSTTKLSSFIDRWLLERESTLEAKTIHRYEGMLKGRIDKALGHLKLGEIKPLHIMEFYRNLQEAGIRDDPLYKAKPELEETMKTKDLDTRALASRIGIQRRTMMSILKGNATRKASLISKELGVPIKKIFNIDIGDKKLSNMTILHYHRLLGVVFHDAIRWGLMRENPCSKVQPPKVNRVEMSCLEDEEIEKLFEALSTEDIKIQSVITLLLVTGCRRGELAALQWKHIDLQKRIISIKQAAINTPKTGTRVKAPKTRTSIRNIKIPASTVQLLKQYRTYWLEEKVKCGTLWQAEDKEKLGDEWEDPEYIFTTWNGHIIFPDTLSDLFRKFLERHHLRHIRLHDLRHTAATILINAGLNVKAVSQRMGHANPNVTLSVYAHAYKTADQEAADIIDGVISKKTLMPEKVL